MVKNVQFNNITIHTEAFGQPENPALLLIMGAASSMIWWEIPFCELMVQKGFYVIRYDNRDTGKSTCYEPGNPQYSFEDLAEDAIQVLDSYGIEKAVIMGMSMGGFLAQIIGVRHPERILGIVLLSTMYFAEGAESLLYSTDEVNEFFATFGQKTFDTEEELLDNIMEQWRITLKSDRPKDEGHVREMNRLDMKRANNFACRINHSVAQVTGDELTRIKEITAPVLVIHGTKDAVINFQHGQMLAKTIPNAKLLVMDGAGHELNPADYNAVADSIAGIFMKG